MIRCHRMLTAACFAAALVFIAPAARANTYLFSFTTSELALALPSYNTNGYFGIFLQVPAGFTENTEASPKPSGNDKWMATHTPLPQLGSGMWIQFSKLFPQTEVTLVSGNASFLTRTFTGTADDPPYLFGMTSATITSLMDSSATFKFWLDLPGTLPGPVNFNGSASGLTIGVLDNVIKPVENESFNLSLIGQQVPEPGTFLLLGLGVAGVALRARKSLLSRNR